MRFFHLSDLHIGLKLFNRDLSEDQIYILNQIIKAAEEKKPDAVVIAGDIYDKAVPSAEAVTIFDQFLSGLTKAVPEAEIMIISGNHDSAPRVNVYRSVLKDRRIRMIGNPPVKEEEYIEKAVLEDEYGEVSFYLLPFVKPSMVKGITGTDEKGNNFSYEEALRRLLGRETIDPSIRNVLVSHQFYVPAGLQGEDIERMDSEVRTVGNIDLIHGDVLEQFDYAALGHIHKPMKVGKDCYRYCGTPLACSVSEAGQQKGIVLVEMKEKGHVETSVLPLHPMREIRKIKGSLPEVLAQACSDYVTVTLTDKVDFHIPDLQEKLRNAFPNLLEIRRELVWLRQSEREAELEKEADPMDLCRSFLGELDEEEEELLGQIINTLMEGGEA